MILIFNWLADTLETIGDDEKVRVWDMSNFECVQVLEHEKWGQITTITYAHQENSGRETSILLIGTGRGNVSLIPLESRDNKVRGDSTDFELISYYNPPALRYEEDSNFFCFQIQ